MWSISIDVDGDLLIADDLGWKMKRLFDVAASVIGLVVLTPLLIVIGVLVRATSSGPIVHRAQRVGLHGQLFTLYKFRSMLANAEQLGAGITAHDDTRITPLGRFLRRTKFDELPQLVNVLKGDMSLVGPRPEDPRYVADYTPEEQRVLSVRPGVTSWASIQFRDEETLLVTSTVDDVYRTAIMPKKLALDLDYVAKRSFRLDLIILWHTVLAVFRASGCNR